MIATGETAIDRTSTRQSFMSTRQTYWAAALGLPLVVGPLWCLAWGSEAGRMGTLAGFVLLAVLATSAVTDAREHRIYNWATYSAFLWAVLINLAASFWYAGQAGPAAGYDRAPVIGPAALGGVGIWQCLGGAGLCFLIGMFGYHLSGRGAGDVKLAAVIGAVLGVHDGVYAVAYSYIVAAIAIVAWSTWANGPLAIARAAGRSIGTAFGPLWPFPPTRTDSALLVRPIPLGPYFAIGTLLVALELVPV